MKTISARGNNPSSVRGPVAIRAVPQCIISDFNDVSGGVVKHTDMQGPAYHRPCSSTHALSEAPLRGGHRSSMDDDDSNYAFFAVMVLVHPCGIPPPTVALHSSLSFNDFVSL
jgi:hypothetical protein